MAREDLAELGRQIRAHPQFLAAAGRSVQDYLSWRTRLGVLNKLISNLARERILELLMFLHFNRGIEGRYGATFERLASSSEARDGIGSRAVRTTLRLAQIAGHVTLARSFEDGRLRIYEPTPALMQNAADYYAILTGVLEELTPNLRMRYRIRAEPGYLEGMLAHIGRAYLKGERSVGERVDAFDALLRLEGGRPILATVVDCHLRQTELPPAPELARRFHVSASQARAVLKNAQARGLIELGARGRLLDGDPLTQAYLSALTRTLAFLSAYGEPETP